ncbi:pilS cassette, partial [Neisseria meningitidis]
MIFVNPLYRNVSIVIPAQAGIRFFEFQSFLIHSHHFSLPDSRFCGND